MLFKLEHTVNKSTQLVIEPSDYKRVEKMWRELTYNGTRNVEKTDVVFYTIVPVKEKELV